MLSTRSSVSETSIVVVIFSLPPLRISAADELRLYRTLRRWAFSDNNPHALGEADAAA
jgi:hypothetical protein